MAEINRRRFIKESLALSAGGALAAGMGDGRTAADGDKPVVQTVPPYPTGKIGNLQVSRLIMGSNLITYYAHSRDLNYVSNLARHYNTEDKIMETLRIGEQNGINTIAIHSGEDFKRFIARHRKEGGKLQWMIGVECGGNQLGDYEYVIGDVVERGAAALYLHGNASEKLFNAGKLDMIPQVIEAMRKTKLPVGVGCHDLRVVELCEKNKYPFDYYVKTFHHHKYGSAPRPDQIKGPHSENPGYWCKNPEETIELMKNCEKAWVAFKVMAAGAIQPKDAFKYVYENGADHILAGMFDFQVAEDAQIGRGILADLKQRARPWRS
ncbi:MAG TPA: hypothetical protein VGP72_04260 [Planctomycetota bacterium]|jgi:hypothetical protein